jgi:hypothetical protein
MRKSILAVAALAGVLALPTLASAQSGGGAAAGAATGGVAGAIVGGPVGAVVGAGVGAAAGASAEAASRPPEAVVVQPAPGQVMSERTCTTDAAGNRVCTEVRR